MHSGRLEDYRLAYSLLPYCLGEALNNCGGGGGGLTDDIKYVTEVYQ